jgi:predicted nucleic acid-binding protein
MNASIAFLIDSNVLVYAHDPSEAVKQRKAIDLLGRLRGSGAAALSVQSLSEFFSASRKLPQPLPRDQAAAEVERFARSFPVLPITANCVLEACRVTVQHKFAFWDAMFWAVAKVNQVAYVLSEDGDHGRFLEGVRIYDPFREDFDVSLIGA